MSGYADDVHRRISIGLLLTRQVESAPTIEGAAERISSEDPDHRVAFVYKNSQDVIVFKEEDSKTSSTSPHRSLGKAA